MKYRFTFNADKCIACGACAVACMDQNDADLSAGGRAYRSVTVAEHPDAPRRPIAYLSTGCMHCAAAPCVDACPIGCLTKNDLGLTEYDSTDCIGCQSCAAVCPFGAPAFRADGKMEKCDGCQVRLEHGLLPACVRICPTGALGCLTVEE